MEVSNPRIRFTSLALVVIFVAVAVVLGCGGAAAPATHDSATSDSSDGSAEESQRIDEDSAPLGVQGPAGGPGPQGQTARNRQPRIPAAPAATIAAAVAAAVPTPSPRPAAQSQNTSSGDELASLQPQAGRQLIVEAWISLEVDDIDPAVRQVELLAAQRDGWVESAEIYGEGGYRSANVNLRVPAGRFDNTMDALRGLGRATDEGVSSTDVTERLIDNEANLKAWYTQEERLIVLLENARTVEDIIDIERRISEVRSDIEHVEATQRDLTNRIATSLIAVNLSLPNRFAAEPPEGNISLAAGDPSGVADSVVARAEALGGYIGRKLEYQNDRNRIIELTAYVKPSDLESLMQYASTLGEVGNRQLSSVGAVPAGDIPNAALNLTVGGNVDVGAELVLSVNDPVAVATEIRNRAHGLGGFTETLNERRDGDDYYVNMEMVVKSADLRSLMDYAATFGEPESWTYGLAGQQSDGDTPNARLRMDLSNKEKLAANTLIGAGVALGLLAIGIAMAIIVVVRRRERRVETPNLIGDGSREE